MGVRYIMKDSHEVWICKKNDGYQSCYERLSWSMDLKKKIIALRQSMDLQKIKKMGVCYIMKVSHKVWIWKKNDGYQ